MLGCNPFVPRKLMEDDSKEKSKDLKSCLGLEFAEYNGTVIGFTDLQNPLEWILRKKSMQDVIKTPNDSILAYFHVDLFPWLSWGRFFTGETTIRMKMLESTNTLTAVATVGAWLWPDTHDFVSNLPMGKFVFEQMKCISTIIHPTTQKQIKVYVRGLADGAQRRGITGCSSASS